MSAESEYWLNRYTLIGYTDERGPAWHYRRELQEDEDNHYPGAIPVDDVRRRLFNFKIEAQPWYIRPNGKGSFIEVPNRIAMVTSDTKEVLGVFKDSYQGHDYEEWLIDNWGHILDTSKDELGIGSAGLLKNRAQAWVQIERPETITTKEGVQFRPHFLGTSSFDGSLATGYGNKVTNTICDNTMGIALAEKGQSFKLRHTKYSTMRIHEAREALGILFKAEKDFMDAVAGLTKKKVSDKQFETLLDMVIPFPADPDANKRGQTVAEKKRDEIMALYKNDERAAPWTGTAYGVLQAFNTWNHHNAQVRKGAPRYLRNMENVVTGSFDKEDNDILEKIAVITA